MPTGFSHWYQIVVVDNTGLSGRYDCHLVFKNPDVPDEQWQSTAPNIWTAIQRQLGIKVPHAKGPVEIFSQLSPDLQVLWNFGVAFPS